MIIVEKCELLNILVYVILILQNYLMNRKFKMLNDNLWTEQTWDTLFLYCQFWNVFLLKIIWPIVVFCMFVLF